MFVQKKLEFPHKAVLTGAMLEEIYSYPREFSRLRFEGYSDGIISGLDYFIKDGDLILSSGIFRLDGELYFLPTALNISELAEENNLAIDRDYFLVLEKKSSANEQCITTKTLELTFAAEKTSRTLGRFVFKGKKFFSLPDSVSDTDKIFRRSVFDLFDVPFAAKETPTFHPQLFRQVKNFLRTKPDKTPLDFAILFCLMNSETISVEVMTEYIAAENKKCDTTDRKEFFRTFLTCISESRYIVSPVAEENHRQSALVSRKSSSGKLI